MKIYVSGVTFFGACDPRGASGVPEEEGWPEPHMLKVGKGQRFVYEGDAILATQIASHLETLAAGYLSGGVDPELRVEGRAFAKDAARIRKQIAEADATAPHPKVDDPITRAAREALDSHDALRKADQAQPPSNPRTGLPYDADAWLAWKADVKDPAFERWSKAMDEFSSLMGDPSMSRHPWNFRPMCQAVLGLPVTPKGE